MPFKRIAINQENTPRTPLECQIRGGGKFPHPPGLRSREVTSDGVGGFVLMREKWGEAPARYITDSEMQFSPIKVIKSDSLSWSLKQ